MSKKVVFFYNDYESLGIEYISAVLKTNDIKTNLVYKNIADFYAFDSPEKIDHKFIKKIAQEIVAFYPDVLALSLLTDTFYININIASEVKKLSSDIKILAGGPHAILLPELTLNYPQIDAVCIGEGEFPLLNYINKLDQIFQGENPDIEGIVYKHNNNFIGDFNKYYINENLDDLPYPDKDLFFNEDPSMKEHYIILSSRGCPYFCSYCMNSFLSRKIGKKRLRTRSYSSVIEELEYAKKKYSPSVISFADEVFGANLDWAKNFFSLYKQKINLPFYAVLSPNIVTEELIELMKDSNCYYIQIGVQSLNEKISWEVLKRHNKRNKIANAINIIKSKGIIVKCDHIFGIPGETREDLIDALKFYNENRPSIVSVYNLTYYPKALITDIAFEYGILSKQDIKNIEQGEIHIGLKRIGSNEDINFWMNYFIFFPKWFIRFIIKTNIYTLFKIKNPIISTAVPRTIHALLNKKDYNRFYLKQIILKKLRTLGFRMA